MASARVIRHRELRREELVRSLQPDQWKLARKLKQSDRRALTHHGLAMESIQPTDFGRARMIMLTPKGEQLRAKLLAADSRTDALTEQTTFPLRLTTSAHMNRRS